MSADHFKDFFSKKYLEIVEQRYSSILNNTTKINARELRQRYKLDQSQISEVGSQQQDDRFGNFEKSCQYTQPDCLSEDLQASKRDKHVELARSKNDCQIF